MIEFLKHFFGICGEHWHPNIFHVLFGSVSFASLWLWVKSKIFMKKSDVNLDD